MSHIEQKAERIASDLSYGQVGNAARELRCELDRNPREALALIQMANQMRDPRSPDHIVVQNGNVFVRDEYHHTQTYAGHLDFNRNYGRQDDCDPRYNRGGYDRYNQGGYDNRNDPRYNQGRNDNCDPRYGRPDVNNGPYYGNPYPNGGDCPPVYRQPEVYPRQQIYIPDCYGNGERNGINAGTAALLVLGGVVLGRSLGHGGGHYSVRDHRR
ncbi:MAG: hypothetical protein EKK48_23620 [Candidatus Melainabacteria bacterium]|nr:MAG: hypothetical protein EKK48_23620 [Candidatus Melainabacteria bacterium]